MKNKPHTLRSGIAWLELLLSLAVIALVFQIWPNLGSILLFALYFRNWSQTVWFVANVVIVVLLLGIHFGPRLANDWREQRQKNSVERKKADKAQQKKKEREALERMQESRSRRIY